MKVSIRDHPQEIYLSTVTLGYNWKQPDNLYFFRCYRCGTGVIQVKGNISGIFPGQLPTADNEVVLLSKCAQCKEVYTFQTKKYAHDYTKLTLIAHEGVNTFHCLICRTQLLQYTAANVARLLPEGKMLQIPGDFSCFKPDCKKKYRLIEICVV